jgi:hypothetical protein
VEASAIKPAKQVFFASQFTKKKYERFK